MHAWWRLHPTVSLSRYPAACTPCGFILSYTFPICNIPESDRACSPSVGAVVLIVLASLQQDYPYDLQKYRYTGNRTGIDAGERAREREVFLLLLRSGDRPRNLRAVLPNGISSGPSGDSLCRRRALRLRRETGWHCRTMAIFPSGY